jgi:hypothetical protein
VPIFQRATNGSQNSPKYLARQAFFAFHDTLRGFCAILRPLRGTLRGVGWRPPGRRGVGGRKPPPLKGSNHARFLAKDEGRRIHLRGIGAAGIFRFTRHPPRILFDFASFKRHPPRGRLETPRAEGGRGEETSPLSLSVLTRPTKGRRILMISEVLLAAILHTFVCRFSNP